MEERREIKSFESGPMHESSVWGVGKSVDTGFPRFPNDFNDTI